MKDFLKLFFMLFGCTLLAITYLFLTALPCILLFYYDNFYYLFLYLIIIPLVYSIIITLQDL